MINWLRPQYLSLGTKESNNQVWGIGWAVDYGAVEVQTWQSVSEFCQFIHGFAEPPSTQVHNRPRRILWHLNYPLWDYDLERPDIFPEELMKSGDDEHYYLDVTDLLLLPEFQDYLEAWMIEEQENAIMRASWFDPNPSNEYRADIRSLLWALIPMKTRMSIAALEGK